MSIYDLPVPGTLRRSRSIYDTGFAAPPIGLGTLPPLAAPTVRTGNAAAGIYGTPDLPPIPPGPEGMAPPPGPEIDPEDPSLFARATDIGLGGLSMLGNFLDLPGSQVRDLLTWLPGGIEARNPFDQLLSPFTPNNRTTGEELLRLDEWQPDSTIGSIGKYGAGLAAEIALDPLTVTGLGLFGKGAGALSKGGELVRRSGLLDDASKVASQMAGDGAKVGPIQAKQRVTALDLARNADDASRHTVLDDVTREVAHTTGLPVGAQSLVEAYNGLNARAIREGTMSPASIPQNLVDEFAAGTKATDDLLEASGIPKEMLNEPIGGNFRFKVPFRENPINVPFTDKQIPAEFIFNDLSLPMPQFAKDAVAFAGDLLGSIPVPRTGRTAGDFVPDFARNLPGAIADGKLPGESLAAGADAMNRAVFQNPLSLQVSSAFDRLGRGAKHLVNRVAQREASQKGERMVATVRASVAPLLARMDDVMREYHGQGATPTELLEIQLEMDDYIEGVVKADNLSPRAQKLVPEMDQLKGMFENNAALAEEFGVNQQRLTEGISYERSAIDPKAEFGTERKRVAESVAETFGEEGVAFMPVVDARARTWAQMTGKPVDDYYKERFADVRKGTIDDVGKGALMQNQPRAKGHNHVVYDKDSVDDGLDLLGDDDFEIVFDELEVPGARREGGLDLLGDDELPAPRNTDSAASMFGRMETPAESAAKAPPTTLQGRSMQTVERLLQDPEIQNRWQADAGVSEGVTIGEHTSNVLARFGRLLDEDPDLTNTLREPDALMEAIALHDIGKPDAIRAGDKARQHEFTLPLLRSRMEQSGHSQQAIAQAEALIGHDVFGELLQGRITPDDAAAQVRELAKQAMMPVANFARLAKAFYKADASSYPFLESLLFRDGQLKEVAKLEELGSKLGVNLVETSQMPKDWYSRQAGATKGFSPANVPGSSFTKIAREMQGEYADTQAADALRSIQENTLSSDKSGNYTFNAWQRNVEGKSSGWSFQDGLTDLAIEKASGLQDIIRNAPPLDRDLVVIRQFEESVANVKPGDVIESRTITASSMDPDYAGIMKRGAGKLQGAIIEVPKGTRGFAFNSIEDVFLPQEQELVFGIGQKFDVIGKEDNVVRLRARPMDLKPVKTVRQLQPGDTVGGKKVLEVRELPPSDVFEPDNPASLIEEELASMYPGKRIIIEAPSPDAPGRAVVFEDMTRTGENVLFQGGKDAKGAVEFLDDGRAIMTAFKGADLSTLVHETAHIFRRDLPDELQQQAASALGVADWTKWDEAAEEAFASAFERYMRDGKAPTKELQGVFDKFKDWLVNIYQSIVGTPLENEIAPELRDVFDQMLGKGRDLTPTPLRDEAGNLIKETKVLDSPVDYLPRARQSESGLMRRISDAMGRDSRSLQPDGFSTARADDMRHLRTSTIQRMSIDPEVAGIADQGVMGRRQAGQLRGGSDGKAPNTGVMGSRDVDWSAPDMVEHRNKFFEKYDPMADYERMVSQGRMAPLDPEAIDELTRRHEQLFRRIATLDRAQVERGVPMFATNPFEAGLKRLESGVRGFAHEITTRRLFTENARLIKQRDMPEGMASSELAATSGNNIDAMNMQDTLTKIGLDHDRAKQKLLTELQGQGHDIEGMTTELIERQRDGLAGEMRQLLGGTDLPSGNADRLQDGIRGSMDRLASELEGVAPEDFDKAFNDAWEAMRADDALVGQFDPALNPSARKEKTAKSLVKKYIQAEADPNEILNRFELDSALAADIAAVNRRFTQPEEVKAFWTAYNALTSLFKSNVTAPFPSFHMRNLFSAVVQNAINGVTDPTAKSAWSRIYKPYADARKVLDNKTIEDASSLPAFQGEKLTPEQATERIREQVIAQGLTESPGDHNDLVGQTAGRVIDSMPGRNRGRNEPPSGMIGDLIDKIPGGRAVRENSIAPEGTRWRDSLNFLKGSSTAGTRDGAVMYAPERWGRAVGNEIEGTVRIASFIAFLRQGFSFDEAARRVKELQIDYSDLTDVERNVFRRAVPFYAFQKGAAKYLVDELAQRPGGPVAIMTKASENASGNDPGTPAYLRDGLNIPLGGSKEDGSRDYLTGAGLMHEPPAQMLGNSLQDTAFNMARMLHPLPKGLIEYMTDSSLFMEDGRGGGRDLDDLDPPVGGALRNVSNFLGITDNRRTPIDLPIPFEKEFELAVANSPLTRYLNQLSKLTDTRKSLPLRALNNLTGAGVSTVDANRRDAVLREQLEALLREMGGRTFSQAYMPDELFEEMGIAQQTEVQQIKEALRIINARRRNSDN